MGSTEVRAVVVDVVTQYAPEEAPVPAALAHVDDADVVRILRGRRKIEPLGFGFAEVVAVVTPVVWLAVDEACRSAVRSSVDSGYARLAGATRRLLRRPSAAGAAEGPVAEAPELSRDQLDLVPVRDQLDLVHRRVTQDARDASACRAGIRVRRLRRRNRQSCRLSPWAHEWPSCSWRRPVTRRTTTATTKWCSGRNWSSAVRASPRVGRTCRSGRPGVHLADESSTAA